MQRKLSLALTAILLVFAVFSSAASVSAYTQVDDATTFYYLNGTSFTNPGNYDAVRLEDNMWYFNGTAYVEPTPTPAPSPAPLTAEDAVGVAVALCIVAIALAVCLPLMMRKRQGQ